MAEKFFYEDPSSRRHHIKIRTASFCGFVLTVFREIYSNIGYYFKNQVELKMDRNSMEFIKLPLFIYIFTFIEQFIIYLSKIPYQKALVKTILFTRTMSAFKTYKYLTYDKTF